MTGEIGNQMGMRLNGFLDLLYCQSAGHSQVNAEGGVALEADEDLLAAALDGGDAAVFKQAWQISILRLDNVGPEVADGGDALADQVGGQGSDDGFNFGEFRHATISLEAHP